ncbi:type II CAAX endopeptidase family protein [Actinoplanes sp. NBRC 101535]|uniref:CPBP family intramembrane glutamic endopeptidase n=1 Tax=Actinoplanes sp. NBRC 101535 TaxID=3032196 RepID=UPI0024A1FE4E|nr:type II CAAX endopeptidase family protein [Actinoplanes sp. NBRC 101535]GLY06949.1 CAAX amino protease [Actinoplanes sp. NBRC 101535]
MSTRPLLRASFLVVVFFAVTAVGNSVGLAAAGNPVTGLLVGGTTAALTLWLYHWLIRRYEERRPDEIALAAARPALLRGFGLGVGLFTAVIAVIAMLGGYRAAGWGSIGGMLGTLGLMIGVATCEEVLFRGVILRLVEEKAGTTIALTVSGLLFGLIHLSNTGATVWGALAIAAEAGLMLGAAYVLARNLWLPIGLHLGWNFAESGLFGATVSGGSPDGLLRGAAGGADLVSGGIFGPEASIVAVAGGLAVTVLLLRRARRQGRLVAAPWR